jgi:hypothetical protein
MNKQELFKRLEPLTVEHFSRPHKGLNQGKSWPDCFNLGFKRTEGQSVFTRTNKDGILQVYATGRASEVVREILGHELEVRPNGSGGTLYCYWEIPAS